MQSTHWRRVGNAALNFARSPLPTLAVWVGDALSWAGVAAHEHAVDWRMKRQASRAAVGWAIFDAALIVLAVALIWWVA